MVTLVTKSRSLIAANHTRWLWIWIISLSLPCLAVAADPPAKAAPKAPGAAVEVEKTDKSAQPPGVAVKRPVTPEEKQKVLLLTLLLSVGVATTVLLLFLWVLWWSRRTHRLLREPLPPANRGDELWYLKTKRRPSATNDPPATGPGSGQPPAPPAQ